MKFWMVENTGPVGYDEYDSFVVRAATAEDAKAVVGSYVEDDWDPDLAIFWRTSPLVIVTEVPVEGEPRLILGSFNAG